MKSVNATDRQNAVKLTFPVTRKYTQANKLVYVRGEKRANRGSRGEAFCGLCLYMMAVTGGRTAGVI